ncbi:MAG TPA: AI-2E family transporter [Firmicutes bacterium]|nr:AI-2E family transporter [Bacillota bacterium]
MNGSSFIPSPRSILIWGGSALGLILLYSFRAQILPALTPFLFAVLLAYLLSPFVEALERRKVPRTLAILIIYSLFISALVMAGVYGVPAIVSEVNGLIKQLPSLTQQVQALLAKAEEQFNHFNLPPTITEAVNNNLLKLQVYLDRVLNAIPQFVLNLFGSIVAIILIPILSFYMLKDIELIKQSLLNLVPGGHRGRIVALFSRIDDKLGAWIRGQLTVGFIVGFLTFIGLEIVGMDFALVLGIVVGITNIIPYFGPIIGAAPALFLGLLRSPLMFVKVLIVQVVAQQLESNLITPQILGRQLGLHPLLIIFALLLGAQFGGVVGLLFAVPITAVVREIVIFWREQI